MKSEKKVQELKTRVDKTIDNFIREFGVNNAELLGSLHLILAERTQAALEQNKQDDND